MNKYCELPKSYNRVKVCTILSVISTLLSIITLEQYGSNIAALMIAIIIYSLLVISIIDWNCYEIPFKLNLVILACSIVLTAIEFDKIGSHLLGACVTGGVFLLLYLASKGAALGFGDVKLMFFAGLGLGLSKSILTFVIAFVLAAILHPIFMKVLKKGKELAFGPYIALGVICSYLFGEKLIYLYMNLFF
ncbi:MAG: A24 family peptidase [Clostridia bacterium]